MIRSLAILLLIAAPALADVRGKVVAVHDGDTLTLESKQRIRLHWSDAPEISQAHGQEAKRYTEHHCLGKVVTVIGNGDSYGRLVGEVILPDGSSLNLGLIKWGHAWVDPRYHAPERYKYWEKEARQKRRGLWRETNPQAPWDYRHGR